jgi:hypothetical protein
MSSRLTIQLIGSDADGNDVRFSELITQLEAIKAALKETESCIHDGSIERPLDYRVVDLKHSSPATFVLEPILDNRTAGYTNRVLKGFTTELRRIREQRRLIAQPEMSRLAAYRGIGRRPKSHIREVRIALQEGHATREAKIDQKFKENLKDILGPDIIANGAVSGKLEYLNLHNVRKFRLYPNVGPKRINGTFREDKRAAVRSGMDQYVTVFGKLKYKTWDDFPYEVQAEDIQVHEPDEKLPTFNDLKGIAPGMTGDLNSAEWVRRIRDEEW